MYINLWFDLESGVTASLEGTCLHICFWCLMVHPFTAASGVQLLCCDFPLVVTGREKYIQQKCIKCIIHHHSILTGDSGPNSSVPVYTLQTLVIRHRLRGEKKSAVQMRPGTLASTMETKIRFASHENIFCGVTKKITGTRWH